MSPFLNHLAFSYAPFHIMADNGHRILRDEILPKADDKKTDSGTHATLSGADAHTYKMINTI